MWSCRLSVVRVSGDEGRLIVPGTEEVCVRVSRS